MYCSLRCVIGINLTFAAMPQALNQHPPGALGVVRTLLFALIFGLVGYAGAFWALWIPVHFFLRRSYGVLHRVSLPWGAACFLLLPAMYIVAIWPGKNGGIVEVSVMILILIAGAMMCLWTLLKSKREQRSVF